MPAAFRHRGREGGANAVPELARGGESPAELHFEA